MNAEYPIVQKAIDRLTAAYKPIEEGKPLNCPECDMPYPGHLRYCSRRPE